MGILRRHQELRLLEQADRYIAETKHYIAQQREIVQRLRDSGGSGLADAIKTLAVLEGALRTMEAYRRLIESHIKRP
jgi:hypothetical protein